MGEVRTKPGILNPVKVNRRKDGTCEIIDGAKTVEAAIELGIKELPCIVYEELSPAEVKIISHVLNTDRDDLNKIEEALSVKYLINLGYTTNDLIAEGVGSKSSISKLTALLNLPEKSQHLIAEGKLDPSHGAPLLKLKASEKINNIADLIVKEKWSVKKTEKFVKDHITKTENANNKVSVEKVTASELAPGVRFYAKDSTDMSEQKDESVDCISFIMTKKNKDVTKSPKEQLEGTKSRLLESSRVLKCGCIMAIATFDDSSESIITKLQGLLCRSNLELVDKFIIHVETGASDLENMLKTAEESGHTAQMSSRKHISLFIFKKKGDRILPSQDIIDESKLTRDELKKYIPSVETINPYVSEEMCLKEITRRIIKMYSFVGDTILDPTLGEGTIIEVARELGRECIGYEAGENNIKILRKKYSNTEEAEQHESVSKFVDRQTKELEANQPGKPKVEIMASKGMMEEIKRLIQEGLKETA